VTQSEGECPLSVHPVVRLQTLIVVLHSDPSVVQYRGRKRQYISCLHIHIIKKENKRNILSFYSFDFLNFSPQQDFLPRFNFVTNLRPEDRHLFLRVSGQKFAMLELKSTISQVLRSFKVIESDSKEDLRFTLDFILQSSVGLKVKLQKR